MADGGAEIVEDTARARVFRQPAQLRRDLVGRFGMPRLQTRDIGLADAEMVGDFALPQAEPAAERPDIPGPICLASHTAHPVRKGDKV